MRILTDSKTINYPLELEYLAEHPIDGGSLSYPDVELHKALEEILQEAAENEGWLGYSHDQVQTTLFFEDNQPQLLVTLFPDEFSQDALFSEDGADMLLDIELSDEEKQALALTLVDC